MEDKKRKVNVEEETAYNPLRNERVKLEFVPQQTGLNVKEKGHVMEGGVMVGAKTILGVPTLRTTGAYKNVLTNAEKDFLEDMLGLPKNALSVYNKENNYWDNYYITIDTKEGLTLDLSDPEEYIRYKVLLANSDVVCPSRRDYEDMPKGTYRFVITKEAEDINIENVKMDTTMKCYKEFGKIEDDVDTMRVLLELLEGRPYGANTKRDFLRGKINNLIQANAKRVLETMTDPLLHTKVVIRLATEAGKISKRGDYYYLRADGSPLCETGEDPTLNVAARYLNLPSHADIKFSLENEVGTIKEK